jgi:Flp pilus assembly protein TadD
MPATDRPEPQSPASKRKLAPSTGARASSLRLLPLLAVGLLLIGGAWWLRSSAWVREVIVRGKDLAELQALVSRQPDDPIAQYYLGRRYVAARRFSEATEAYEAATRLDPGSARAHLGLGLSLFELGKLQQAHDELAVAVHLDDRQAPAEYTLGKIAWMQGNLTQAVPHLQRATQLDSHSAPAWYGLAVCFVQQERRDLALDPLKHAIACDETNAQYHTTLGELLVFLGRTDEGRQQYERALQLAPDYGPAVALMGDLCLHHQTGTAALMRARDLLQRATHLKTLRPQDVYLDLGETYFRTGDYSRAVPALREAIRLAPHDRQPYYQLAQVERKLGDRQATADAEARFQALTRQHTQQEALEVRVRQTPGDAQARLQLARLYADLGQEGPAAGQYRAYLQMRPDDRAASAEFAQWIRTLRSPTDKGP